MQEQGILRAMLAIYRYILAGKVTHIECNIQWL